MAKRLIIMCLIPLGLMLGAGSCDEPEAFPCDEYPNQEKCESGLRQCSQLDHIAQRPEENCK